MFEITQATIARIYLFVNYELIRINVSMGYGLGPMRKIQRPHPSIKREGMRRPKSFEWIWHPSVVEKMRRHTILFATRPTKGCKSGSQTEDPNVIQNSRVEKREITGLGQVIYTRNQMTNTRYRM